MLLLILLHIWSSAHYLPSSLDDIVDVRAPMEQEPKHNIQETAPVELQPQSIPTEYSLEVGANVVSSSTIKRNLRIQPVNVRDFAKYMKSKSRDALRHEWEVRIIFQLASICTTNGKYDLPFMLHYWVILACV